MYAAPFKLPKQQVLRQRFERDCGVAVFAELAGISYEDVLRDLPDAHLGTVTDGGWMRWLEQKGFTPLKREGCPEDIVPCAHMVAPVDDTRYCHWVYRDAEGDIHDPSPSSLAVPADDERMRKLSLYDVKVMTISISR